MSRAVCLILLITVSFCFAEDKTKMYDVIIRNGTVYDGSGMPGVKEDVAIQGDSIAAVGDLKDAKGKTEVDASGMAVAPGFINMLSWAVDSLIADGHSESDIRQGVTLEVFGEGNSMGPLTDKMKKEMLEHQGDIKFDIKWTSLREYLEYLQHKGISTNVASFIGATTVRIYTIGYDDSPPTPAELAKMKALVRQAMEDGAMGVGSSLIYAPAFYAKTDELIELCKVASEYHGMYISHMRSEGNHLLEAIDELIKISREANIPAEIYHLKAAGKDNWGKLDSAIQKIEGAQKAGSKITADMYTYTAGATSLDASIPPWAHDGGQKELRKRLQDPKLRERIKKEMDQNSDAWENLYYLSGSPENILLVSFAKEELKPLTGKTLAEVAKMRGKSPEDTLMDLTIEEEKEVGAVYFMMSEDNVKKELALPWVSFGSDEGSYKPEGVFLKSNAHPRAYGNFARVLGKYVRDEKVVPLEQAIRKLSSLPASNLKLERRGTLKEGNFADVVVFDPNSIADHATFDKPHQFATGVVHVFVNGVQVLKDGQHTGATPGRVVYGPGFKKK
ncbi:MAG: aminoacylase [Acidobacteria bacterium]|nr:MAG: aminoacylase [Acidobacteriota bacterium]